MLLVGTEVGWRFLGLRLSQVAWLAGICWLASSLVFLFSFGCWNFFLLLASCSSIFNFTTGVGVTLIYPGTGFGSLGVVVLGPLTVLAAAVDCCGLGGECLAVPDVGGPYGLVRC